MIEIRKTDVYAKWLDGLNDIRTIVEDAQKHLVDGGYLIMEHGWQQSAEIRNLLSDNGYHSVQTIKDLAGHERITLARLN